MREEKPADGLAAPLTRSLSPGQEQQKDFSKSKEQTGNVYENTGPLWKTRGRSWNVYENKALICLTRECC
jgi:hypothetical protein